MRCALCVKTIHPLFNIQKVAYILMEASFTNKVFPVILSRIKIKRRGAFMYFSADTTHTFFICSDFMAGQNDMARLRHIPPFVSTVKTGIKSVRSSLCALVFTSTFRTIHLFYLPKIAHNKPVKRTGHTQRLRPTLSASRLLHRWASLIRSTYKKQE